jgi:hypothetical protein
VCVCVTKRFDDVVHKLRMGRAQADVVHLLGHLCRVQWASCARTAHLEQL